MSISLIKKLICIKSNFLYKNYYFSLKTNRGSAEKFNFGKGSATKKRFRSTGLLN